MQPSKTTGRSPHYQVSLSSVSYRNGSAYLRLRWRYQGKQKNLALGMVDTPENRVIAKVTAAQIQSDLATGNYDDTLAKYRPERLKPSIAPNESQTLTLGDLYSAYTASKARQWKENTKMKHEALWGLICKAINPHNLIAREIEPLTLQAKVEKHTKQVRAIFEVLSAVYQWAIDTNLLDIPKNPIKPVLKILPKHNWQENPEANAFTTEDKEIILQSFRRKAPHYYPFVHFLFLTGCRPSEAVGLTWEQINWEDNKPVSILFDRSISFRNGKAIFNVGSKNNKARVFPCNSELQSVLMLQPKCSKWVFCSPTLSYINLPNFSKRQWADIARKVKPECTVYDCRDTFITEQALKGISTAVIGKWCDTSPTVIQSRYLDGLRTAEILPV